MKSKKSKTAFEFIALLLFILIISLVIISGQVYTTEEVFIFENNSFKIDTTKLPAFNTLLKFTFSGLTFTNPKILKDGVECGDTVCTNKTYNSGTLSFYLDYNGELIEIVEAPPSYKLDVVTYEGRNLVGGAKVNIYSQNYDNILFSGVTNSSGKVSKTLDSYKIYNVWVAYKDYLKNVSVNLSSDNQLNFTAGSVIPQDRQPPTLFLLTSLPSGATKTSPVDFKFNVFDSSTISNCSLLIDNSIANTKYNVSISETQTFTKDLTAGNYIWQIKCSDEFGNNRTSENRTLTVTGDVIIVTHSLTTDEFLIGARIDVVLGDLISFNITIGEGENATQEAHYISIEEITETSITIKVWSEEKTATLNIGDSQMFELSGDEYYDLSVTFIGVVDGNASLIIESVYELVPSEENATCGDGVCQATETQDNCCLDCGCPTGYTCQDNICISKDTGQPIPATTVLPTTAPPAEKAKGIAIKIIIIILILIVIFLIFRPTKGLKFKVKVEKKAGKKVKVVKRKR